MSCPESGIKAIKACAVSVSAIDPTAGMFLKGHSWHVMSF